MIFLKKYERFSTTFPVVLEKDDDAEKPGTVVLRGRMGSKTAVVGSGVVLDPFFNLPKSERPRRSLLGSKKKIVTTRSCSISCVSISFC